MRESQMPTKQNPFSIYDFLGYLIPGAILLLSTSGLLSIFNNQSLDHYIPDLPATYQAATFLAAAYIAGHVIGIVSSFSIEKSYIRLNGYPSRCFLKHEPLGTDAPKTKMEKFWDLHLKVAQTVCGAILGNNSYATDALKAPIVQIINTKLEFYFSKEHKSSNLEKIIQSEYFHHIYHYCVENAPNHLSKIQNYVALYGLMRNTAFTCLIAFWLIIVESFTQIVHALFTSSTLTFSTPRLITGSAALLCFSILYLGFVKFYKRYSLEIIMAFSVSYSYKPKAHESFSKKILS